MSVTKIAGVMRAGAYSPNHIGNDAAIFNAAAEQLRKRGYLVMYIARSSFVPAPWASRLWSICVVKLPL